LNKHKHLWKKVGGTYFQGRIIKTLKRCIICGKEKEVEGK